MIFAHSKRVCKVTLLALSAFVQIAKADLIDTPVSTKLINGPPAVVIKPKFNFDQKIVVKFNIPWEKRSKANWIAIYKGRSKLGVDLEFWARTCNTQADRCPKALKKGQVVFDVLDPAIEWWKQWPLPTGNYQACLFKDNGNEPIGSCRKFKVQFSGAQRKALKGIMVYPDYTYYEYGQPIGANFYNPTNTRNSLIEIYDYTRKTPEDLGDPLLWLYTGCNNVLGDQKQTNDCGKKSTKGDLEFRKGNTGKVSKGHGWPLPVGKYSMLITIDNNLPYKNFKLNKNQYFIVKAAKA